MLLYFFWVLKEIFWANIFLLELFLKKREVNPIIFQINHKLPEWKATLFANSITITPGTLTLDLTEDIITIHTINQDLISGVYTMQNRIEEIKNLMF